MSAYRQIYKMGDNAGDIIWELIIANTYDEIFGENPIDVDIFEFGSIKKEGETATLEQKEDEFDFFLDEAKIQTADETACALLMKQSEYSDVWIGVFEHESETYTPCDFNDLIISGLVRRKSSAQDLLWNGQQWNMNPNPLRTWKFTAQSFGAAVLDKVSLTSKKVDGVVVAGVLDEIEIGALDLDITPINLDNGMPNIYIGAVRFDAIIRSILERTQQRLQSKMPGLIITLLPSETAFTYTRYSGSYGDNVQRKIPLFESNPLLGLMIDSRLIKPNKNDDGLTIAQDYQISWHRYESVTDLLYNLSVCFGTQLRIKQLGEKSIEVSFVPIVAGTGKQLKIIDAISADIDLQSTRVDSGELYYCRATDICNEGNSYSIKKDNYAEATDKISSQGEALPLSVSVTRQRVADSNWNQNLLYQNCELSGWKTHKMAWTGMLAHFGTNTGWTFDIISKVATTVNGKAFWYDKLSDCLNSKISANGEIFSTEYKIKLPFIKSVSPADGELNPSLKHLELWDKITIDSKEYIINSIEIKPSDGEIELKLCRSSRYGFVEPETPVYGIISEMIPPGALSMPDYAYSDEESGAEIIENDLVMYGDDGLIYPYRNLNTYSRYEGISASTGNQNTQLWIKTAGKLYTEQILISGKPVYARYDSTLAKCVPSANRLTTPSINENIDICIGRAINEHIFIVERGNEYKVL